MVHKKITNTIIPEEHKNQTLKKHYNLNLCTLQSNECSYQTRKESRQEFQMNYNSVLKAEDKYFKQRGLSHDVNSIE